MISIEIPVIWGKRLKDVLSSINQQTFDEYEVVIVDSSNNPDVARISSEFGAKRVVGSLENFYSIISVMEDDEKLVSSEPLGLLAARYLSHKYSSGTKELILDETRLLHRESLEKLNDADADMVILREEEVGHSIWIKLANLDKKIILEQNSGMLNPTQGFLLPRFFKREVLDYSFNCLLRNISPKLFAKIVQIDHQLIFTEAYAKSKSVWICPEPMILHYGDKTMSEIVRKYYRYGKSDSLRSQLSNYQSIKMRNRIRTVHGLHDKLLLYPLYFVRGIAYFTGYYFGSVHVLRKI